MADPDPKRTLKLHCAFHPSLALPFKFNTMDMPVHLDPTQKVFTAIDIAEELFSQCCAQEEKNFEIQINVIWHINKPTVALNPNAVLGDCFAAGETFGVYGDIIAKAPERPQLAEDEKTPVTILTGFLGAGKTTLLNYILQEQQDLKIAVIENELGEISIDDALLQQSKLALAEKVVVMDNGCMCCTIRGDLVNGLMQIIGEINKGTKIDAIMIETTGMADPVPIVRTFMTSEEVTSQLRLDGVVCVADAKNLPKRLDDKVEEGKVNEAYQQVAFADKILLNKLDLVKTEEAIAIKDQIRGINKFAKVVPCIKGRCKLTELSNMRAHDMCNFANIDIDKEAETAAEFEHGHGAGHDGHGAHSGHGDGHNDGHGGHGGHGDCDDADCKEEHGHGQGHGSGHGSGHVDAHGHVAKKSRHDSRYNSMALVKEGEILPQKLGQWMQSLAQFPKDKGEIFRIKAILAVKGHPYKHVFHAVMDCSDEDDAAEWAPGEKKISKIVFIGKGLDMAFLRSGWESIFADADA